MFETLFPKNTRGMKRQGELIFIFLWSLVPIVWVFGALYLDRFHFETNYRAGLLIAYMVAMTSWGVMSGFAGKRDQEIVSPLHNSVLIALVSFVLFFSVYFLNAYLDSRYYRPGGEFLARLPYPISVGFQSGTLFSAAPFFFGYIPGGIAARVYRGRPGSRERI